MSERLIEIAGLSKSFGSVHANRDISIHVDRGEIVALLGENGAGKSTLVKQIFGLLTPDAGTITIAGDSTPIADASDAIGRGIGMVHQHFQLVPVMTVAENIILGHEPLKAGRLDMASARQMVTELSQRYGLDVDPDAEVDDLPVGTQQRVEILKALSRRADLLILDEPTAVLTPAETDELLEVMRQLAAGGTSIVFITHKLREVLDVSDRVYVLRQGAVVGEVATATTDAAELATMMVGRDVVLRIDKHSGDAGEVVLEVDRLAALDDRRLSALDGCSFSVRAGEILGIAGVEGNGQRELVECIAGMRPSTGGSVRLGGENITGDSPAAIHDAGVGHIPENREKHGLIASFSVADNLVVTRATESPFADHGIRRFDAVQRHADALIEEFDIRLGSSSDPVSSLSGGNKQKVVVAREMYGEPRLLLAAQPTRGVDVGSIEFIHRRLIDARDAGAAVLLVSAELDEVMSLSDRIAVIHDGHIVAEFSGDDADRSEIGRLMAGGA